VTVGDVQAWMDTLEHLAPASRARKISSVKSLFGFGHRLGYLPFDVGRVVKRPKLKDTLAERILSEGDVHKLLVTADRSPSRRRTPIQEFRARRNYVLLLLLYAAGLRVDEVAGGDGCIDQLDLEVGAFVVVGGPGRRWRRGWAGQASRHSAVGGGARGRWR
jgi:integrase/recombinase XerD